MTAHFPACTTFNPSSFLEAIEIAVAVQKFMLTMQTEGGDQAINCLPDGISGMA